MVEDKEDDDPNREGADADALRRGRARADDEAVATLKCDDEEDDDVENDDEVRGDLDRGGDDRAARLTGSEVDDDEDDDCKYPALPPPRAMVPLFNEAAFVSLE